MIAQNDRCDTLIIVTDEQQNAGSPFYKRLRDYRYKVNKDARAFVGKTRDVSEERDKRLDENFRAAIECLDKLADRPDLSDEQMSQISEEIVKVLKVQNEDAEAGRAHQRSILRTVLGGVLAIGALAIGGPALMKNVALGLI